MGQSSRLQDETVAMAMVNAVYTVSAYSSLVASPGE